LAISKAPRQSAAKEAHGDGGVHGVGDGWRASPGSKRVGSAASGAKTGRIGTTARTDGTIQTDAMGAFTVVNRDKTLPITITPQSRTTTQLAAVLWTGHRKSSMKI